MSLVILRVSPNMEEGNSLINFPTELLYLVLALILKVSAVTLAKLDITSKFEL
jgi:hypothetical protein